ncbi:MAG: response regulator [Verrucomicrobia bacterium]|nr:response regulator [Verrucomicrobiota bacterium]
MKTHYDYQRFAILYVDDEEKSLKYFTLTFGDTFRIFTAPNAQAGYQILEDHQEEIGLILSDQRMAGEKGVQFLERARRLRPQILRVLVTAFSDLNAAIDAINSGAIYKYVTKPWDVADLEVTLKRCLEFFMVQTERDLLMREKLSALHRLIITDRVLSLGLLAAGLGNQLHNTFEAVQQFLELAPEMAAPGQPDPAAMQQPAFWQEAHRNVQTQVRSVLGLLDSLAEQAVGPFEFTTEVNLRESLDDALVAMGPELSGRRIQVSNLVPAELPRPRVDLRRFSKLFPLLLQEELASLKDGAVVRIEAALRPADGLHPAEIEVFLLDDGPGLSSAALLAMVDPVFTRNPEVQRSGVLLMACYFIVYHHGGRIRQKAGAGRGQTLSLTLPVEPVAPTTAAHSEEFLVRAMTNDRLWERLLAGTF